MATSFERFGPVKLTESSLPLNDLDESQLQKFNDKIKVEKSDIKKGYERVKEKIKTLRQGYRQAVNAGTRSGSGRIVRENWNDLTAGSPATKAIENACTSREINEASEILEVDNRDNPLVQVDLDDGEGITDQQILESNESDEEEPQPSRALLKRLLEENPTPKFVDNKRKVMEKQLSAKQREIVMINAAKKEIKLKTTIAQGLLDSNKNINNAMSKMADSINSLGNGLVQGFSLLAQALNQNQHPPNYPVQGMMHHHPMVQFNPRIYQPQFEMENHSIQRHYEPQ